MSDVLSAHLWLSKSIKVQLYEMLLKISVFILIETLKHTVHTLAHLAMSSMSFWVSFPVWTFPVITWVCWLCLMGTECADRPKPTASIWLSCWRREELLAAGGTPRVCLSSSCPHLAFPPGWRRPPSWVKCAQSWRVSCSHCVLELCFLKLQPNL